MGGHGGIRLGLGQRTGGGDGRKRRCDGAGKNEAWLMAGGTLYSVDLATGKATEAAKITGVGGTVKDIAIMGM